MCCGLGEEEHTKIRKKKKEKQSKKKKKLNESLPANPVNDRRVANAVTLKSTFCLPLKQQSLFKEIWLWNLRKSRVKIFVS